MSVVSKLRSSYISYHESGKGGHETFFGEYLYQKVGASVETGAITSGINLSLGLGFTENRSANWVGYAFSLDADVGAGVGTPIAVNGVGGKGNLIPLQTIGPKGFWETVASYRRLLLPIEF